MHSVHAHEILTGLLTDPGDTSFSGASVALRVLAESRRDGYSDEQILRRSPVVVALCSPQVKPAPTLPDTAETPWLEDVPEMPDTQVCRETLRLRVRWLQELTARGAWELGRRLADDGIVADIADIRHLDLDELDAVVVGRATCSQELIERRRAQSNADIAPLPARFRMSDRGRPISQAPASDTDGGTGAGGGSAEGVITHDALSPPDGSILVVGGLAPEIEPQLPRLAGIVAETGSVLSHLAILAREQGVATVIGHRDALDRLAEGVTVRVDGDSGRITLLDDAPDERCDQETETERRNDSQHGHGPKEHRHEDIRLVDRHRHAARGRGILGHLARPLSGTGHSSSRWFSSPPRSAVRRPS